MTLNVEGKPVKFLVDTGATFSVLRETDPFQKTKPLYKFFLYTGKTKSYPWTQGGITDRGKGMITHSFLVMPDCPYPLLDRDLLQKLHATISFHGDAATLTVGDRPVTILFSCPLSEKYILFEAPGPLNLAPFSKNYSRPFPMCGLKPIHLGWPLTSP